MERSVIHCEGCCPSSLLLADAAARLRSGTDVTTALNGQRPWLTVRYVS